MREVTINGNVAGTITAIQMNDSDCIRGYCYLNGFNGSKTLTFEQPYRVAPAIMNLVNGAQAAIANLTATSITITTTTPTTGYIIIEGF